MIAATTAWLAGCAAHPRCDSLERLAADDSVVVVGDSVFDFNGDVCGDVGDFISLARDARIEDRAVGGTWLDHPSNFDILEQYTSGPWSWVIVDGGANDLNEGCGCDCTDELDTLVSEDTLAGAMPTLVEAALADGAKVLLFGYYDPAPGSEFAACQDELVIMSSRYQALAERLEGVTFVDGRDIVSAQTQPQAFHGDGIHLTPVGAELVANTMLETMSAGTGP